MDKDQERQFLELVSQYCEVSADDIQPDMRFREDLKFNSLDFMAFLGELEDTFDIELDEEKAATFTTIEQALEYAGELLAE